MNHCPNCEQIVPAGGTACPHCGWLLIDTRTTSTLQGRRRLQGIGAAMLLVLLVAAALFILRRAAAPPPDEQPAESAAAFASDPAHPTATHAEPTVTLPPTVTSTPTPAGPPRARLAENGALYLNDHLLLDPAVELPGCQGAAINYAPGDAFFVLILNCTGGDSEVFSFRADGTDRRRLTSEWDYLTAGLYEWSADGHFFSYQRSNSCCRTPPTGAPPEGIVQVNIATGEKIEPERPALLPTLAGSGVVQVTDTQIFQYTPDISPDQQSLLLAAEIGSYWQVAAADPQGNGRWQQITNEPANYHHPQYAPDGHTFLAASDRDGDLDIYELDAATGAILRQLTNNPGDDTQPRWLPDGSGFLFAATQDGNSEIYLGMMDGRQTRLTSNSFFDGFPAISPDGSQIVFYSNRDGDYDIYRMPVQGGDPFRVTISPGRDASPVFSPDGRWIVFESARNDNYDLFAVDLDGNKLCQLTFDAAGDWYPAFSRDGQWLFFQSLRSGNMEIHRLQFTGCP